MAQKLLAYKFPKTKSNPCLLPAKPAKKRPASSLSFKESSDCEVIDKASVQTGDQTTVNPMLAIIEKKNDAISALKAKYDALLSQTELLA